MDTELRMEIAAAIEEGKLRMEDRNAKVKQAVAQRQAEERAELLTKWAPLIEAIKGSIPPWAHQFLTHPIINPDYYNEHTCSRRAATIAIPDTATIFAYGETNSSARFRPARYAVSDDDEIWSVIMLGGQPLGSWERGDLTNDFHIALAVAVAEHDRLPELHAEAERRNAERQKAKVEQPPRVKCDWVEQARLAVGQNARDQAAIAYALIGILEQLQKVTTPLYGGSQHAIQTFDNSRGQL